MDLNIANVISFYVSWLIEYEYDNEVSSFNHKIK